MKKKTDLIYIHKDYSFSLPRFSSHQQYIPSVLYLSSVPKPDIIGLEYCLNREYKRYWEAKCGLNHWSFLVATALNLSFYSLALQLIVLVSPIGSDFSDFETSGLPYPWSYVPSWVPSGYLISTCRYILTLAFHPRF